MNLYLIVVITWESRNPTSVTFYANFWFSDKSAQLLKFSQESQKFKLVFVFTYKDDVETERPDLNGKWILFKCGIGRRRSFKNLLSFAKIVFTVL